MRSEKSSDTQSVSDAFQRFARHLSALTDQARQFAAMEVDAILARAECDEAQIEQLLDRMLSFCCDEDMLENYKRLCRCFYAINASAAVGYVNAYREMWDARDAGGVGI